MNKRGIIIPAVILFQVAWGVVGLAALWNIPAWEKAKKDHTEAAYQAQPMWPQVQIAQFAQGNPNVPSQVALGNGGNFAGGNSGPV